MQDCCGGLISQLTRISAQLQKEMPGLRGFGARNIRNMRQFYEKWAEDLIWQTPSAKLESDFKETETLHSEALMLRL